jgi:hypothetical protein
MKLVIFLLSSFFLLATAEGAPAKILGSHSFLENGIALYVDSVGVLTIADPQAGGKNLFHFSLPLKQAALTAVDFHLWRDINLDEPRGLHFMTLGVTDKKGQEHWYTVYGTFLNGQGKWLVTGENLPFANIMRALYWTPNGQWVRDWTWTETVELGDHDHPNWVLTQWGMSGWHTLAVVDLEAMKVVFRTDNSISCGNAPNWEVSGTSISLADHNEEYGFNGPDDMNGHVISSCDTGAEITVDLANQQFVTTKSWTNSYP